MQAGADFVMIGWRSDGGYNLCASSDLLLGEIETIVERDAEWILGSATRFRVETRRYEIRAKCGTCYMVRGTSYGDCLVRLMEHTDFNPDRGREVTVDVELAPQRALPDRAGLAEVDVDGWGQ